jgi:hypothetical protein
VERKFATNSAPFGLVGFPLLVDRGEKEGEASELQFWTDCRASKIPQSLTLNPLSAPPGRDPKGEESEDVEGYEVRALEHLRQFRLTNWLG